jgi:L-phenylalanine/L-methionine N-acetyltransferase
LRTELTCNALHQAPPTSDGAFLLARSAGPLQKHHLAKSENVRFRMEDRVSISQADFKPADTRIAGPPGHAPSPVAGLILRAQEPSDWAEIAALSELPKVRWGTLRIPFTSKEWWRKRLENPSEDWKGIVAVLDGRIVGSAGIFQKKGRSRHACELGMWVHDDFHGRGIGSALMAALIDVADNWLDLKRIELKVYVDNAPAIALYRKFGFEVEGTVRFDAFRDGKYVDSFAMARLRPGWSGQP